MTQHKKKYSSIIIKGAGLLDETRALLSNWDPSLSTDGNFERAQRDNIFAKVSRKRTIQVLRILRRRYFNETEIAQSLVILEKEGLSRDALKAILYFLTAQSDPLLRDAVAEIIFPFAGQGRREMEVDELVSALRLWVTDGRMTTAWNDKTLIRTANGILTALRDFGILEGLADKRLAPVYLPVSAFAFIAFLLLRKTGSPADVLRSSEWSLFLLSLQDVEKLFLEAHQRKLLTYHAAGSVIRITFSENSPEEFAHALAQRENQDS
ncbi:MAG: BrxA family protein [Candidatus Xenobiia bacterium LiM19]